MNGIYKHENWVNWQGIISLSSNDNDKNQQ